MAKTIEYVNPLLAALRSDPKSKHLFTTDAVTLSYKTGFPTIDYGLGTKVNVFNEDGILIDQYPSIGIPAGSIVSAVGKSAVGKTALLMQIASNIVRPFESGFVSHYDIEKSTTPTRVSALSRFPITIIQQKYILKQLDCTLESLKEAIADIWLLKISDPEKYRYNTGLKDEFNQDIWAYQPTCMIIDSVPAITTYINPATKDGLVKIKDISTQTDMMRLNGEISRFLREIMEMLKQANIILFLINHIKQKPSVGFPQQSDLRWLKQDETIPGGRALQYYSSSMFRLTSVGAETYTEAEHGIDGFGVILQLIKSRSSVDGTTIPLVFVKKKGYDALRSNWFYAKEHNLIGGNKNGYYYVNNKDTKFTFKNINNDYKDNRELYQIMYDHIIPSLDTMLTAISPEEMEVLDEEMAY